MQQTGEREAETPLLLSVQQAAKRLIFDHETAGHFNSPNFGDRHNYHLFSTAITPNGH